MFSSNKRIKTRNRRIEERKVIMICKKIKRTDLKWYQILWNIITGHRNRNYGYVESKGDK